MTTDTVRTIWGKIAATWLRHAAAMEQLAEEAQRTGHPELAPGFKAKAEEFKTNAQLAEAKEKGEPS